MMFDWIRSLFQRGRVSDFHRLENKIGYRFRDTSYLQMSLSHRSFVNTTKKIPAPRSNERLEFLGDAVLNSLITDHLYRHYPEYEEGQLSKMKSLVVSAKVLNLCATEWNLGEYVYLSKAEAKSGGRERPSILADTFEAVLGAVYLDGGYEAVRHLVQNSVVRIIDQVLSNEDLANFKSQLLEFSQSKSMGIPFYEVLSESGPEHRKIFVIAVKIQGKEWGRGTGTSKKIAEQAGAREAMESLLASTNTSDSDPSEQTP